ncbi:hypothetical protein [Azospirillum sp. sgz301742]
MQPFLHSLQRDWATWSRLERIVALALLVAAPLAAAVTIALGA